MLNWDPQSYCRFGSTCTNSPNLPTVESVYAYPSTVMLEACNLSEGRGTGLPFQFVGAPYLKSSAEYIERVLHYFEPSGVHLREAAFEPTSSKWKAETCLGLQIHFSEPQKFQSFPFGLARSERGSVEESFAWKQPPTNRVREAAHQFDWGDPRSKKSLKPVTFRRRSLRYEGLDDYRKQAEFILYPRIQTF